MKRAQGIKKRWEKEKLRDTEGSRTAPLSYLIDFEYSKYTNLCYWCHEEPLTKGKWLYQEITESLN